MPLPFELTAENVINYAREKSITLERGAISYDFPKLCIRGLLSYAAHIPSEKKVSMYSNKASKRIGLNLMDLEAIENGFEGCEDDPYNEYYKLGREVWRLTNEEK